jgi:hypothetical protein
MQPTIVCLNSLTPSWHPPAHATGKGYKVDSVPYSVEWFRKAESSLLYRRSIETVNAEKDFVWQKA